MTAHITGMGYLWCVSIGLVVTAKWQGLVWPVVNRQEKGCWLTTLPCPRTSRCFKIIFSIYIKHNPSFPLLLVNHTDRLFNAPEDLQKPSSNPLRNHRVLQPTSTAQVASYQVEGKCTVPALTAAGSSPETPMTQE